MPRTPSTLQAQMSFWFGEGFMEHYAGHIVSDPCVALVELVANAYDAGASEVRVEWPSGPRQPFSVSDNGTGMTREQFEKRWRTLSYQRIRDQGPNIQYPPDFRGPKTDRPAFGRNGQGRFSSFCFSDAYRVETWCDGALTIAAVRTAHDERNPFECDVTQTGSREGHGTVVCGDVVRHHIPVEEVVQAIGSKFAVVRWMTIYVNGNAIQLTDLTGLQTHVIRVPEHDQAVSVHTVEADRRDRTMFLRGIAWWVHGRMVGSPSWEGLTSEGNFLDGRSHLAGSCSFIVEADGLRDAVKADWTGFRDTPEWVCVRQRVQDYVVQSLRKLDAGRRKQKKTAAVRQNREALENLPQLRRTIVGEFIDRVLDQCPSLSERDLGRAVQVFTGLEASTSGFDLLKRLAQCSPSDLDTWERIMSEWSAAEAALVLDELGRRLRLLEKLEAIAADPRTEELREIHPLVASGLWMFGPEF